MVMSSVPPEILSVGKSYQNYRKIKGHWDGGEFNSDFDKYNGAKYLAMQVRQHQHFMLVYIGYVSFPTNIRLLFTLADLNLEIGRPLLVWFQGCGSDLDHG